MNLDKHRPSSKSVSPIDAEKQEQEKVREKERKVTILGFSIFGKRCSVSVFSVVSALVATRESHNTLDVSSHFDESLAKSPMITAKTPEG